jgi:hypothetical protein
VRKVHHAEVDLTADPAGVGAEGVLVLPRAVVVMVRVGLVPKVGLEVGSVRVGWRSGLGSDVGTATPTALLRADRDGPVGAVSNLGVLVGLRMGDARQECFAATATDTDITLIRPAVGSTIAIASTTDIAIGIAIAIATA